MVKSILRRVISYVAIGLLAGAVLFGAYLMIADEKVCASKGTVSKEYVAVVLRMQTGYHRANGKFADSLSQLNLYAPGTLDEVQKAIFIEVPFEMWKMTISSEQNVLTIFLNAREKKYSQRPLHSQIGRIVYNNEQNAYERLICKSRNPGSLDPQVFTINSSKLLDCPASTQEDC
jgi:Type IV pilin-like G and H, putative